MCGAWPSLILFLVFIHDDIEPPVQAVPYLSMVADDFVEALRGRGVLSK